MNWRWRLDGGGPLIWLAYLPLFFIPWFFTRPLPLEVAGASIGLATFLVLYFKAWTAPGNRLIGFAITVLLLSFVLAYTRSNWTVIAIYAASMIAHLRPLRRAQLFLAGSRLRRPRGVCSFDKLLCTGRRASSS